MLFLKSTLATMNLSGKRVLLRIDANVPLNNGHILDDYRLQEIVPTINIIQKKGGKVILATHIGRPEKSDETLSTKQLIPWFIKHGYTIDYEANLAQAYEQSLSNPATILLLENMRFFEGEKNHDELFAQQLARLGDIYVNDAFGLLHRDDTSITLVPRLFAPENRTIGLLVERELTMLNKLIDNPRKPFTLVLGGGKVADKIPLLQALSPHINALLLCPAPAFTFLLAQGKPVGTSLVDEKSINACSTFLSTAQHNGLTIHFPIDYQIAHQTFTGNLSTVDADQFPADGFGISIGPKTEPLFAAIIGTSGTVLLNGIPGDAARKETLHGAQALLEAAAQSQAITIVCGGDSVAIARMLGFAHKLTYLSTGGGASLAYISGESLPGLMLFT